MIAQGTCGADGGNLTWNLTSDGTFTINGKGEMAEYTYEEPKPWSDYEGFIKTVVVVDGVTGIGNAAFWRCTGLTSVIISEDVMRIGDGAFASCTGLTSVLIPEGVASIGIATFSFCESLPSVAIPGSVKSIGYNAFEGCTSLISVTLSNGVKSIGDGAFSDCMNLVSVTIPEGVTSIEEATFSSCVSLVSVRIPNSVASIGASAFFNTGLTTVTIPVGVTNIEHHAFSECRNLASVIISESVTSIGDNAFSYCLGLEEITVKAEVPPSITWVTFNGIDKTIPVYVPAGSIEDYRMMDWWSEFTNYKPIGDATGMVELSLSESIVLMGGEVHLPVNTTDAINEVQVYDLQGRHVLHTTESHFALPSGMYIIKVGEEVVKAVM